MHQHHMLYQRTWVRGSSCLETVFLGLIYQVNQPKHIKVKRNISLDLCLIPLTRPHLHFLPTLPAYSTPSTIFPYTHTTLYHIFLPFHSIPLHLKSSYGVWAVCCCLPQLVQAEPGRQMALRLILLSSLILLHAGTNYHFHSLSPPTYPTIHNTMAFHQTRE